MTEVITVANHKGGCAKTVTTLNLGYALKELGYKVALVDLDSQANLTTCFGIDNPNSIETNIAHLMIHYRIKRSTLSQKMDLDVQVSKLKMMHSLTSLIYLF